MQTKPFYGLLNENNVEVGKCVMFESQQEVIDFFNKYDGNEYIPVKRNGEAYYNGPEVDGERLIADFDVSQIAIGEWLVFSNDYARRCEPIEFIMIDFEDYLEERKQEIERKKSVVE